MTFSSEDLAIFGKQHVDWILFPLFALTIFYLPGFLFVNILPVFYLDNFYLRQLSYVAVSTPFVVLGGKALIEYKSKPKKVKKMF